MDAASVMQIGGLQLTSEWRGPSLFPGSRAGHYSSVHVMVNTLYAFVSKLIIETKVRIPRGQLTLNSYGLSSSTDGLLVMER